jgi:flagellar biosynthesis protein FlhA
MEQRSTWLKFVAERSDVLVAFMVVGIVMMMIIPMPTWLLDILLTFNISFALVIIIVAVFNINPLDFSVFPSLLLIMTLYRLALNISSTRLILLHAQAGEVIHTFGSFVVGGNMVVGFIIFLILVVIQFIVITKGAERVAEVAARFTLDAMPGKQMAIDADLNAGLINEDEARDRRKTIQREADFYGAMDGASKFVKGDAIAGIITVIINIVAGLIIGMAQRGMPASEAVAVYTILTVGDGLVTQIPALLMSSATGIIVTRSASQASLGKELSLQIFSYPKALGLAAVILFIMGTIGMPRVPMYSLGTFFLVLYLLGRNAFIAEEKPESTEEVAEAEQIKRPENVMELPQTLRLIPHSITSSPKNILAKQVESGISISSGTFCPVVT